MKRCLLYLKSLFPLLTLATLVGLVTAHAQLPPSQSGTHPVAQDRIAQDRVQDSDTTRGELASFDRFMDGHPEIAEQLRRDPSLVKNEDFVRNHPSLQEYLQQHPGVREEITENPDRFMRQEQRFDRREGRRDEDRRNEDRRDFDRTEDRRDNDTRIGELASFDRFMDSHPEIAEQLRRDPSLAKKREFVEQHPALQEYLEQHPGVQQEISENPDRFMRQEQRFDRREDRRDEDRRDFDRAEDRRDNDARVGELANFDRFMDSHPEISEQLRRDPSLVTNEEFVRNHPALQEYLQQHPEVHEQITENPNRFMRQEQRFDRIEDSRNHEIADGDRAAFGQFLSSHGSIAQELSKEPWLANNEDYQKSHPDLQQYLKTHPGVQAQLKQDPQTFMKSTQQFGASPAPRVPSVELAPKAPTIEPMPKQ